MDNRFAELEEDTHMQEDFALLGDHRFQISGRQEHLSLKTKHYFQGHGGLSISQFTCSPDNWDWVYLACPFP